MNATGSPQRAVIGYDSESLDDYNAKWEFPMGLGEMAIADTRKVENGVFSISAVPFRTGSDTILDHAKYYASSHTTFPMPKNGSLEFSVNLKVATPGTEPGRVIHGHYTDTPNGGRPYAQPKLEGQQAAVMFNMTNVETGQLFDWFVSGNSVFALLERLPTYPEVPASDPRHRGMDKIHTQIVKAAPLEPGTTHRFALRYTRDATQSAAEYVLDGVIFARVDHVGIPLDTQGVPYTGIYPSYHNAPGEELKDRMNTFVMKHGLYGVIDEFPFQNTDAPELAVSVPLAERLFGQGAEGEFSTFQITTISN
jgi:hypothetical protein